MNVELTEEKLEILKKIFIRNYKGFTSEEISFVQELGKGITFREIMTYFEYIQDHDDLLKEIEQVEEADKTLINVVSCLYTCDQIVNDFSQEGYYSDIPMVIKFRVEKGLEPDYVLDYEKLITECLSKNNLYETTKLYAMSYNTLSNSLKKEVYDFVLEHKSEIYVSDDRVDGIIDLLKFGQKNNLDISELWEMVTTPVLIKLCVEEADDIIQSLYEKTDDNRKRLIDSFYKIKNSEDITKELFDELVYSLDDPSSRISLAQFAVKKGYIPPVNGLDVALFQDKDSIATLSNVNLAYYLLTKNTFSSTYSDDELFEKLTSPELKMGFKTLRQYTLPNRMFFHSPDLFYQFEDLLSIENITKYFDDNGMKIDFMYEVVQLYFDKIDYSYDNSFILFTIGKCLDKIPNEEKQYYEAIHTLIKLYEENYTTDFSLSAKELFKSKEIFYSSIKDPNKLKDILKNSYNNFELVLSLMKVNAIDENVAKTILSERELLSLDVIKELLDQEFIDVSLFKNIYNNNSFFDNNAVKKDNLIKYLVENAHADALLKLSDKYITSQQKAFIEVTLPMFKTLGFEDNDNISFIAKVIINPEELDQYITDNKPTKKLVDKFFEIGFLKCVEGQEHLLSDKQKIIYEVYKSIDSEELKEVYCDFIKSSCSSIYSGSILEETIKKIPELLDQIKLSNSSEVAGRYVNIAKLILQNTNENSLDPLIQFRKIEKIFLTRELSHMDKIFRSFQLLYPHQKLINTIVQNKSYVSPTLYKYATSPEETVLGQEAKRLYGDSSYAVEMVMYSDLLKTTIASNDKTFIDYIEDIERGNNLFSELMNGTKTISDLQAEDKYVLSSYVYHLEKIYNKSHPGNRIKMTNDLERNLSLLTALYKDVNISLIPDQIIKNNYYAYLGISTMQELKDIMAQAKEAANKKGYEYAQRPMKLEKGDLLKGIGDITYFDTIIQNGSVSKEFLGGDVDSDLTPFDTDLSIILETKADNASSRAGVDANSYGPIFFVVKNAVGKYNCTRDNSKGEFTLEETSEAFRKIEIFRTRNDTHYGIRTGFPTSQVDYIICQDKLLIDKIGLVLAKNGYYIPVVDKEGKLIFSPEQYEHFREKMGGLAYYRIDSFEVASTSRNDYTLSLTTAIKDNIEETKRLKVELEEKLRAGFAASGLLMKTQIDGDMRPGSVELIDTGSTSRGTNQIGDGDFDFTIRLDRIINQDQVTKEEVTKKVCEALGITPQGGDLRKAKIQLSSQEVELDISYAPKSDRITYTTDMSLTDRLETIKKQDPEQYLVVLSNIVLAKTLLKKGECYKPHHARENPQGGLGGVGTENWILQNGGSLEEAATEFLIASGVMKVEETEIGKQIVIDETTRKDYDAFKTSYSVWDFGQNQLTETRYRDFPHDNFIWNNMNKNGYVKMVKVMQTYMLELHPEFKFVPREESKEDQEKMDTIVTNVKGLLQGLKPTTYSDTEVLSTEKGK